MLIFRMPWKEFQGLTAGILSVGSGSEESQSWWTKDALGAPTALGSLSLQGWGFGGCSQLAPWQCPRGTVAPAVGAPRPATALQLHTALQGDFGDSSRRFTMLTPAWNWT